MDREYLESFNDEQLEHYLKTLKRRVSDLRQLTIQLGKENEQLGVQYEALSKQKFQAHNAIEKKKKKGWGKWLNKGKEKLSNILHIVKKEQKKNEVKEEPQQPKLQEEPQNQVQEESRQPQVVQTKESPHKKVTLQNFNFDDLYYLGKEKITGLFKKNKEGYHPSDQDNAQLQNGKREEGVRENIELIREITGEQPQLINNGKPQDSVQERQLRRKLLVEAEIAKKTSVSLNISVQQKQVIVSVPSNQQQVKNPIQPQQKQPQTQVEQKQHQPEVKEQKQLNEVDNLQGGEEDHQFRVRFQSQMNEYQLKEENVSQIIQKQAEKAPQSQEEIEEHTAENTEHQPAKQAKQQESK